MLLYPTRRPISLKLRFRRRVFTLGIVRAYDSGYSGHGLVVFPDQQCWAAVAELVPLVRSGGNKTMDNKPAQNIQDSFLNTARKDKAFITIYLLSGVKLTGRIRSFD